jgi:rhamnosyltransferase
MYSAAKMLLSGWKIVYSGNALCRHSHNYSILEEFKRHFDMGVFHSREAWLRDSFGNPGGEGFRYVKSEFQLLGWKRFYLWPEFLVRNIAKLFGYKFGQHEKWLPFRCKMHFSMFKAYWIQDNPLKAQRFTTD